MNPFVKRDKDKTSGVLPCSDRVVSTGTTLDIGYSGVMASHLCYHKIRLFDYPRWAEPLRDELRHLPIPSGSKHLPAGRTPNSFTDA